MTDDFISRPEFNSSMTAVREEIKRVGESVTQVSAKIDTLVNGRIEEARVIGEISGAIKAINERLERQERETAELRRLQESEVAGLKGEIKSVREEQASNTKGHVNWFMQLAMLVIAAIFGSVIGKVWK